MMGNSRRNEKGKAPAYANPITESNNGGVTFHEGNVDEDNCDSILDIPLLGNWEFHRSVAQGVLIGNPRVDSVYPQTISSSNANSNLQEFPLLPYWNIGWDQQYPNHHGDNALSGDISTFGGESSFGSYNNRPQVNRDITDSSFSFNRRNTAPAPVHTRNNVNFDTNRSEIQEDFEGSFLTLGLGGTSETVSSSQFVSRENPQVATGQTFDHGFMSQSKHSGFSNQSTHVNRMTTSNNEFGSHGGLNSGSGSGPHHILQMQQNDRQHGRSDKLKKAALTELKMVHDRKAAGQSSNTDFIGLQTSNNAFSKQYSNVARMASTTSQVGVHRTLNTGFGSSPHHILQMQQDDNRDMTSGGLDHYTALTGNQSVHSGTRGGNSDYFFNSHQHNSNLPEFIRPSWMPSYHTPSHQLQYVRSSTANSPNYAGMQEQVISQNGMPTQVSWVGSRPAGTGAPFPKRLGVEYDARVRPQSSLRQPSPERTTLQTAAAASSVDSQSQKFDFHVRRHHKRTAAASPESASHWVQRQKIVHPSIHPSIQVGSRGQPTGSLPGPIAAHIHSVKPRASNVRHHAPVTTAPAVYHITWKDPDATPKLSGHRCFLCKRDVALTSEGPAYPPSVPLPVAVLPCGHTFHDQCLQKITPDGQSKDPPCIPCAIGEK